MNTADDNPWHVPTNAKLASIVASSGVKPAWYQAWVTLTPQSSNDERLAVYQAIRDSGSFDSIRSACQNEGPRR